MLRYIDKSGLSVDVILSGVVTLLGVTRRTIKSPVFVYGTPPRHLPPGQAVLVSVNTLPKFSLQGKLNVLPFIIIISSLSIRHGTVQLQLKY